MILTDIDTVLTTKIQKFLCDQSMYDMHYSYRNDRKLKRAMKHLQEKFVADFESDILDEYVGHLSSTKYVEEFLTIYSNLKNDYILGGEYEVLINSTFLRSTAERVVTQTTPLYGAMKEAVVDSRVENVAGKFDISRWEENTYSDMFGLVVDLTKEWLTYDVDDSQMAKTRGNVIKDIEEGFFIRDDAQIDVGTNNEMFDEELYVELMETIYEGSAVMFKQHGQSSLRELLSSTVNFLQSTEQSKMLTVLENPDQNRMYKHKITVDGMIDKPYMYRKYGSKEGHLVFMTRNSMFNPYSKAGIGRESLTKEAYDIGKSLYNVAYEVVNESSEVKSASIMVEELKKRVNAGILNSCGVTGLSSVLMAIINARRLKNILQENGYNILQFPSIELRQDTWNRFSNLHELLNYYRVHLDVKPEYLKGDYSSFKGYDNKNGTIDIKRLVESKADPDALDKYMESNLKDLNLSQKVSIKTRSDNNKPLTHAQIVSNIVWEEVKDGLYSTIDYCKDGTHNKAKHINTNIAEIYSYCEIILVPIITNLSRSLDNFNLDGDTIKEEIMRDEYERVLEYMGEVQVNMALEFMNRFPNSKVNDSVKKLSTITVKPGDSIAYIETYTNMIDRTMEAIYKNKLQFEVDNGGYNGEYCEDYEVTETKEMYKINYVNLMNHRLSQYIMDNLLMPILNELNKSGRYVEGYTGEGNKSLLDSKEFIDMSKSFSTLVGRPGITPLVNSNMEGILGDFVKWYMEEYNIKVYRQSRFTDFFRIHLTDNNLKSLTNCIQIYKTMLNYLDSVKFKKLNDYLKTNKVPTGWKDVKEKVVQFVELHDLELSGNMQTYISTSGVTLTNHQDSLQTISGTSIIGEKIPYMERVTEGSYFIFSTNGYKILIPDAITSPITMGDDEQIQLLKGLGVM